MNKICALCKVEKPFEDFHKSNGNKNGLCSYCKHCNKLKIREWKKRNPDKYKKIYNKAWIKYRETNKEGYERRKIYNICRRYGISVEEYNRLQELQSYKCLICEREGNNRILSVDHDHTTGKVRGLLCNNCNIALGIFKEDIPIMKKAIKYLESNKSS